MIPILVIVAWTGWLSFLIERDSAQFHKKMADFWHDEATKMTDRLLGAPRLTRKEGET